MSNSRLFHFTFAANIVLVLAAVVYLVSSRTADSKSQDGINATAAISKAATPLNDGNPKDSFQQETPSNFSNKEATWPEQSFAKQGSHAPLIALAGDSEQYVGVSRSNEMPYSGASTTSLAGIETPSTQVTRIDYSSPGNSVAFNGQRVAIKSTEHNSNDTGDALNLVAVAEPPQNSPAASADDTSQSTPSSKKASLSNGSILTTANQSGFTYEEELFRSKWGWDAFNEARKFARETAGQK
jgi:hypothetical protein